MNEKQSREKNIQRVILVEGTINTVVLLSKLSVGLATGSLAIIGDAIHSLTDVVNNIVALIAIRVSSAPPDRVHPYGHRKFETIAVFFLASLLVVLSFELALHAIRQDYGMITHSYWGLGIMLAVLAVNIVLATFQRIWARKLKSELLFADATHTFSDVMTTAAVILGWQLSAMGFVWLDRVCAIAVSCLVFYLAYSLFKRTFPILVDAYAIHPEKLTHSVLTVEGVRAVTRVRSRWIGDSKSVDLVIVVDSKLSTEASHAIASQVESHLEDEFDVTDISIHVEPG